MAESALRTTTRNFRKLVIFFLVLAVVILILQFCANNFPNLSNDTTTVDRLSTSYATTDEKLGNLQELNLPPLTKVEYAGSPRFTGGELLSNLKIPVQVYKQLEPKESFGSEDIANDIAGRFGITSSSSRSGPNQEILSWQDAGQSLEYNRFSRALNYRNTQVAGNLEQNANVTSEQVINSARSILNQLGLNRSNFAFAQAEVDFLLQSGSSFSSASRPEIANFAKVKIGYAAQLRFTTSDIRTARLALTNPTTTATPGSLSQFNINPATDITSTLSIDISNLLPTTTRPANSTTTNSSAQPLATNSNPTSLNDATSAARLGNFLQTTAPIVLDNTLTAPVEIIFRLGGNLGQENIVSLNFSELRLEDMGTYRALTAREAWAKAEQEGHLKELFARGADRYLTSAIPNREVEEFQVDYRDVKITYIYEPYSINANYENISKYIVPVYVFRGNVIFADGLGTGGEFIMLVKALEIV